MRFRVALLFFALVAIAPSAITFTFEAPDYSASPTGVVLNGQQGWYEPLDRNGSASIHSYAGNTRGIPPNPAGGSQFASAAEPSEHTIDFSTAALWEIAFDIALVKTAPTTEGRAARFSLFDAPIPNGFAATAVAYWNDPGSLGSTWRLGYTGMESGDPGLLPGPAWAALQQNHWYRTGMTVDFASRRVVSAWILDPANGDFSQFIFPSLHFLGTQTPDSIRIFATIQGTASGFDNITITGVPEPAMFLLVGLGLILIGMVHRWR